MLILNLQLREEIDMLIIPKILQKQKLESKSLMNTQCQYMGF